MADNDTAQDQLNKAIALLREHYRCVVIIAKYEDETGGGAVYSGHLGDQSEAYGMLQRHLDTFEWEDD